MKLRDYQEEAVEATINAYKSGHKSCLTVMPTGVGKTVYFSHVISRMKTGRALVIAHRDELIRQAAHKVEDITGQPVDIEKAGEWADSNIYGRRKVVVASIQTIHKDHRLTRFKPEDFTFVVVDEAHHAVADTYRRVIEHFRQNPITCILGVTATPDRKDEKALGQVFDHVPYDMELKTAIDDGWLVPIKLKSVFVEDIDLRGMKSGAKGDFSDGQVEAIMRREEVMHKVVTPTLELAKDRNRILVFTAGVHQAKIMCDIFNRHEPYIANFIHAKTDDSERRNLRRGFASGDFKIMVNVGIYTEGYDEPGIDAVVLGRFTKSRSLLAQMIGRGTRPVAGCVDGLDGPKDRRDAIAGSIKPDTLILDFVGACGKHKLVNPMDILGGQYSDEVVKRAKDKALEAGEEVDIEEALEKAEEEVFEQHRLKKILANARYKVRSGDPFNVLDISPTRERGWNTGKRPSDKQLKFLHRNGVDTTDMSWTEANQLVGEIISRFKQGLCTFKMARILKKHGYSGQLPFERASAILDDIFSKKKRRRA